MGRVKLHNTHNIGLKKVNKRKNASVQQLSFRCASGGVVSWDTSQDFRSSPPVQAFVKPRPHVKPQSVRRQRATA